MMMPIISMASLGSNISSSSTLRHHDGDIVKSGSLHVKRPPTAQSVKIRLKAWQKRYFVLRDESFEKGTTTLEIYNSESAYSEHRFSADRYNVDLRNVTHVEEYLESKSFPNAFTVSRRGQSPLVFAADTDSEMKVWLVTIKYLADKLSESSAVARDNNVSSTCSLFKPEVFRRPSSPSERFESSRNNVHLHHHTSSVPDVRHSPSLILKLPKTLPCEESLGCIVQMQVTEASARNGLEGEYRMIVKNKSVGLRKLDSSINVITWPVAYIRKFKSEPFSDGDVVTLEASLKCGELEGTFLFKTLEGQKLIKLVTAASRRKSEEDMCKRQQGQMDRLKVTTPRQLVKAPSSPELLGSRSTPPRQAPAPPPRKLSSPCSPDLRSLSITLDSPPKSETVKYLDLLPEEFTPLPPLSPLDDSAAGTFLDEGDSLENICITGDPFPSPDDLSKLSDEPDEMTLPPPPPPPRPQHTRRKTSTHIPPPVRRESPPLPPSSSPSSFWKDSVSARQNQSLRSPPVPPRRPSRMDIV